MTIWVYLHSSVEHESLLGRCRELEGVRNHSFFKMVKHVEVAERRDEYLALV